MDVHIKINSEGTTSVKIDGKEMDDSITKLSLIIEPLCAPVLHFETIPKKITFEGTANHCNKD